MSIIQNALNVYGSCLAHRFKELNGYFLEYANSLVKGLVFKGDFAVWPYYHLLGRARTYGCKIPWVSALCRARIDNSIQKILKIIAILRVCTIALSDHRVGPSMNVSVLSMQV